MEELMLKYLYYPKKSTDSVQSYQHFTGIFFTEIEKAMLKIYMEPQETPNSQSNIEQEEQSQGHQTSDFKIYYKDSIIKTAWHWNKTDIKTSEREEKAQK